MVQWSPEHSGSKRAASPVAVRSEVAPRESHQAPPLRHLAIIPDGNRRWAAARGSLPWDGVRQGVVTAERTFEAVLSRHIPFCTFWASSYDNLVQRPYAERVVLNELFATWFGQLADNDTVRRERVAVRFIGEWHSLLAPAARASISRVLEETAAYDGPVLTFLVGYDGDRELTAAVTALLKKQGVRQNVPDTNTPVVLEDLRAQAWTKGLPAVDLLVRTGSWEDPHRSANMLPFLTSNVQEAYPAVYWPDFSAAELDQVLADYLARERRLGA